MDPFVAGRAGLPESRQRGGVFRGDIGAAESRIQHSASGFIRKLSDGSWLGGFGATMHSQERDFKDCEMQ